MLFSGYTTGGGPEPKSSECGTKSLGGKKKQKKHDCTGFRQEDYIPQIILSWFKVKCKSEGARRWFVPLKSISYFPYYLFTKLLSLKLLLALTPGCKQIFPWLSEERSEVYLNKNNRNHQMKQNKKAWTYSLCYWQSLPSFLGFLLSSRLHKPYPSTPMHCHYRFNFFHNWNTLGKEYYKECFGFCCCIVVGWVCFVCFFF